MARKKTEKTPEKNEGQKHIKDDMASLRERVEKLQNHLKKNTHDYKTKRTLLIKQSKLLKLQKFREG